MTWPPFMNRTAFFASSSSFEDDGSGSSSLQDLESNAVFMLAHNLTTPRLSSSASSSLLSDHEESLPDLTIPSLHALSKDAQDLEESAAAEVLGMLANDTDANEMANDFATDNDDLKRPFSANANQVADVVDSVLEDIHWVTPPSSPSPERPTKKARKARKPKKISEAAADAKAKATASTKTARAVSSCSLPTADDPIDPSFLATLYSPKDDGRINPAHCIIRKSVLQVRRTYSGRVLFQCACCKHVPRSQRAKLSTLAPQSVDNLYRAMVRFMMNHVRACEHVPLTIKGLSPKDVRVVSQRGTKKYWVRSAKRMGLRDGADGKSIVYCKPAAANAAEY